MQYNIKHKGQNKNLMIQVLFYILLNIIYIYVCKYFKGFTFEIQPLRIILCSLILLIVVEAEKFIRDEFINFIYCITLSLVFMGELIYFQFNLDCRFEGVLASGLFLLALIITQKIRFGMGETNIDNLGRNVLPILAVCLILPYLVQNLGNLNLKNLLLIDIYKTRDSFRAVEEGSTIDGYLVPILARIVLPYLICDAIEKKRRSAIIVYSIITLTMFLCGALKSILFGFVAVFFFYSGSYEKKIRRFYVALSLCSLLGIILCLFYEEKIIDYMRRIFFVPAALETVYVDYFTNNFTYMAHSRLSFGLLGNPYGASLSMYAGEHLFNSPGLNANIGVFVESYISFGYPGMVLMALFFGLVFQFLKSENIKTKYAGVFFIYIYCMNTAFLHSLLIGHGMLFMLIFSYFFMRRKTSETDLLMANKDFSLEFNTLRSE